MGILGRFLLAGAVAGLLAGGCKEGKDSDGASVEASAIVATTGAGDELLARRDALLAARRALREKRAALAKRRSELVAAKGDPAELDAEVSELSEREAKLLREEEELNKEQATILERQRDVLIKLEEVGGSGESVVAVREAGLASREQRLSEREAALAAREKAHADRVEAWADRWERECSAGGGMTTIVQTVDASGTDYSKKDVEPLLGQARKVMNKKGLLRADLPGQVQGLEGEATKHMKKGDYGRARLAASQLLGSVKSIKVDRGFIRSKWSRLHARMRGRKLTSEQEKLLVQAGKLMSDGKYGSANRQLNRIYATLKR